MNENGFNADLLCVLGCVLGAAFVLGGALVSMVAGKVANMTKGVYLEPKGTQADNPFPPPDVKNG